MTRGIRRDTVEKASWWVAVAAAGAVPLFLLAFVLQGSRMQFGDYFYMLSSIFDDDGTFAPEGLLVHANEHLIAVPKLIYALNAKVLGGSNITLGVFVWLTSMATLLVMMWCLRGLMRRRTSSQVVLVWLLVAACFPLKAMHNYVYGMSGTAWILANLFAVSGVALVARGWSLGAGFVGVLATFTYGTGLALWPAIVVVLIVRRSRPTWRDIAMLTMGALAVAVERSTSVVVHGHPPPDWSPLVVGRSFFIAVGSSFTDSAELAVLLGLALFMLLLYGMRALFPADPDRALLFVLGVGGYATSALLLVSLSRGVFGDETLTAGRYMALSALFAMSVALVALLAWGGRPWRWLTAMGVGLALVASVPTIERFRQVVIDQNVAAVAARIGVAGDGYLRGYESDSGALLAALGNYPFDQGFGSDCGLLGENVEEQLELDSGAVQGTVDDLSASRNQRGVNVSGWAYSTVRIQCVLLIDEGSIVIGAGVTGVERPDVRAALRVTTTDVGWAGVALRSQGAGLRAGVRLVGSDRIYLLDQGRFQRVP